MLAPDDRSVLREQLRPGPGERLDYAVCTTFTLDLTAALAAPLAFATFDITGTTDPVAVLESVRQASERIDVFCQAGQIRVPAQPSDLMAFLEPMVHEVTTPVRGYLFHPKLWVLRFTGPEGPTFRLLCGTRNLTDDVSWDALVRIDGRPDGRRTKASNRPLADLLRGLPGWSITTMPDARQERVAALADDVLAVEWDRPAGVSDMVFHALGLRNRRDRPLVDALQAKRQLIISPFLDDEGVQATYDSATIASTIVSRPEALDRLTSDTLTDVTCKILSPLAGLSQPDDEQEPSVGLPELGLLGGLHAKVYVIEAARQARLFIGSANATSAGLFERNVEFVVEFRGGPSALGIEQFLGDGAPFASLLEEYAATGDVPEPPEETLGRELERLLRRVAADQLTVTVTPAAAAWDLAVRGAKALELPAHVRLHVGLLMVPGGAVEPLNDHVEATFEGVALADVTPFVVLRLRASLGAEVIERSAVVRARLIGDPAGRFDEVIARQVDTPEKFLRFLALLLGLGSDAPLPATQGEGGAGWSAFGGSQGLFELLVRAVADRPEAIVDLDRLVERLEQTDRGRDVMPEGFAALWATVRSAHEKLGSLR